MPIQFSDYTFRADESPLGDGGGTVLVPLPALGYDCAGLSNLSVVDYTGRAVFYEGGGRTYYADSEAGTREFIGWSYWESEASEDLDRPTIHLVVLSPDFDEADYRG